MALSAWHLSQKEEFSHLKKNALRGKKGLISQRLNFLKNFITKFYGWEKKTLDIKNKKQTKKNKNLGKTWIIIIIQKFISL